jgi:hypothetical protein
MPPGRSCRRLLAAATSAFVVALPGAHLRAEAPASACPRLAPAPGANAGAPGASLHEGMLLDHESVLLLPDLLPTEVWRLRETFFHEGMALEVGPCHRVYALTRAYDEASRHRARKPSVDEEGNLMDYEAGLPFPPAQIDVRAEDAGIRWAWNLERRHRGPGVRGRFRLVDMPSRLGGMQVYEGEWSFVQTSHRADLASRAEAVAASYAWVAGGRFSSPNATRHLAWHQLRPDESDQDFDLPDHTFVYIPSMRKVRRAASTWVDGLYMPRYRASAPGGGGFALPGGAANPTSGSSIQVTEHLRRGFVGLSLRPNAYRWRVLGEREVLAPLNITHLGYPSERRRNFGPSGLSIADDRWDVRRAMVIQGALRATDRDHDFLTLYIDVQTQQPLYLMTHRRGAKLVEVGILAHRYTGDRTPEPLYPDGSPVNAFEPVAALFHDARDGGSGWRRESYDLRMTPPSVGEIEALMSQHQLSRGR